jgi:hypothetical protein
MGLRGSAPKVERIHDVLGSVVGADNTDAFLGTGSRREARSTWCRAWAALGHCSVRQLAHPPGAGQKVQDVSDTINVSPEKQQNQVGNIIANATGQVAGLIGLGLVGGEGVVDNAILGQSFDQIDQALKEKGVKDRRPSPADGDQRGRRSCRRWSAPASTSSSKACRFRSRTGLCAASSTSPRRRLRGFRGGGAAGRPELRGEARRRSQHAGSRLAQAARRGHRGERGRRRRRRRDRPRHSRQVGRAPCPAPRAKPLGMREAGALSPDITPEDEASPLPTDLIVQGKMTMGAAEGTTKANQVLRAAGMPDVGTRVDVSHNGRTQQGAVADAWTVNVAGQTASASRSSSTTAR